MRLVMMNSEKRLVQNEGCGLRRFQTHHQRAGQARALCCGHSVEIGRLNMGFTQRRVHDGITGSRTCDGYASVCRIVCRAISIRVLVPTSSPVLRLRLKRGKLELVTSTRSL